MFWIKLFCRNIIQRKSRDMNKCVSVKHVFPTSSCLFMFYLKKGLRRAGVSSFGPFSVFLFSLFLPVSQTLSPYVVLCISQMNQTVSRVK